MRTQSAWEWRVRSGNKALSKCLKAPLFNVFAFNQTHTHIHMVREAESENVLCFCYFLHALSLFRHFSLFISFDALSFPFVSFPSLNPPAHTHTPSTLLCVPFQTLSNVCLCEPVFFIRFLIPFIWIIVAFLYFYPFSPLRHTHTHSHSQFLPSHTLFHLHPANLYNQ